MQIRIPTTDVMDVGNRPGDGPLRAGGQSQSTELVVAKDGDLPSTLSPAARKQRPALELLRDLSQGTEQVRARGAIYLPKAPGEDPSNYSDRLQRSVFFNVVGRTIDGLVGQVFKKDPILSDDVPAVIKDQHWENIDLAGTHGDVFCRDVLEDAITAGHAAILVEFPTTGGTQNAAQEKTEIRPYWVPIKKDNILSWRTAVINGQTVLTQIVLREASMVPDGAFGEEEYVQYRVLFRDDALPNPIGYRILHITKDKKLIQVSQGFYGNQVDIPISEIPTAGRNSLFDSDPMLVDLAYLNVAHYQQWSDYATSIHMTCVPLLTLIGFDSDDTNGTSTVVGPMSCLRASNPQAKAEYVSHDGAALDACKAALDDLKSDMGTMGIQMLAPQKRSAETLGAKQIDKSTEESALAVTARGLQDGIERALSFHARYLKLPSGGSIAINRDFDEATMQADMLTAWAGAVSNAGVPARFMLEDMQVGGLIPPNENVDVIADEMAANKQAADDAKAQQAMDLLAAKQPVPVPAEKPPVAA